MTDDKFHWDDDNENKRIEMKKSIDRYMIECEEYLYNEAPEFLRKEAEKFKKDYLNGS